MMRSLFSGVSGMQNHQTRMDVIGNNVANVNTTGFKRGRVNFQDLISQQLSGASRPTEELGGVNPKEVGLGMMVASIDTIFTQGALQTTGVNTDLAIQGNGFFVLKDGEKTFYTRAGAFGLDRDGTLVNPANGMRVQGWMAQEVEGLRLINTSGQTEDLSIPIGQKIDAKATTSVDYSCNLDKRLPELPADANRAQILESTWSTEFKVYDSFGEAHELQIDFARVPGEVNAWRATVNVDPANAEASATRAGMGTTDGVENSFIVRFDNNGHLASVTDTAGNVSGPAGKVSVQVSFNVVGANPEEGGAPARQTLDVNLGEIGTSKNTITQFSDKSTTKAYQQDGYGMGYLENFRIDQSGVITGVYSNGVRQELGQIAMAGFANQGGLEKAGQNTYVQSNNSGIANISTSGTVGKGYLIGGTLEMSNVDLTDQFVDMIVTQKGFQAGAKTIQTSDTMLETVLNLKR
ncbi:flagellar hook protein FlgE [Treponema sp. OMZ 788]|uniref:flagellar hook protein FlgE n=1 Tax=unclassified Treponema TaxID=2638727 RepID=UPI0020A44926|nr:MULTISPECIES: flagellar hook protein FlgE [unclassified Treponema]UTC62285.1 flagellar hook protein FlgE [Treponema sp. OMZ 787]UTC64741.1 flagellar hook protein FlgE [Treponema sp. OMZ 788]